jgi:hypothetical protein
LPADDFAHSAAQPLRIAALLQGRAIAAFHQIKKLVRARQAAGMGGKNAIATVLHRFLQISFADTGNNQSSVTCAAVMTFFQRSASCLR